VPSTMMNTSISHSIEVNQSPMPANVARSIG
jgi:hypothetical protein